MAASDPTSGSIPEMVSKNMMSHLVQQAVGFSKCPVLISECGQEVVRKYLEFFIARTPNPNTRTTYLTSITAFLDWVSKAYPKLRLETIEPLIVSDYCHQLLKSQEVITVTKDLAAIRVFFNYLVENQLLKTNPATAVKLPRFSRDEGSTPVPSRELMLDFMDSIKTPTVHAWRDKALLGTMYWTAARVSAVTRLKVGDYKIEGSDRWMLLREKGGKERKNRMSERLWPILDGYIAAAGIAKEKEGWLFRAFEWQRGIVMKAKPISRNRVWRLLQHHWNTFRPDFHITCHSFRAAAITHYLESGGSLDNAQRIAGHASMNTTRLYDRRSREVAQGEYNRW